MIDESVVVDAPLAQAWAAWADPAVLRTWWPYAELDVRVGGRMVEQWQGVVTRGLVFIVDEPHRFRMTWADSDWPAATQVEVSFGEVEGGTEVRVRHMGWAALADPDALIPAHREGWRTHLRNLALALTPSPSHSGGPAPAA